MKKSKLKEIIKEEIAKVLSEIHPFTIRRINKYIDDTHHMESNDFLDDLNIPGHVPINSIYQLRDIVDNFLDSPEGSEAEELFQDTIVQHLKTAGKGFTDQQIEEYIQLLKLRRDTQQIGGVKLSELYAAVKKSQLKQVIKEEIQKVLKENEYLDQLLDKISSSGIDSLSDSERNALNRYSKGENPTPEKFRIRLEKDGMGGYHAFLYRKDNQWIPQDIFDEAAFYPYDNENISKGRIYVHLNTYPEPDADSGVDIIGQTSNTKDPGGARINLASDKREEVFKFFEEEGNMDNLRWAFNRTQMVIPGKYVDLLKF